MPKQPKKSALDPSKINILNFRILEGAVHTPYSFEQEAIESYEFQLGFDMGFNLDDRRLKADFKIKVTTISKDLNEDEATGMFHLIFIYEVENLDALAKHNKESGLIDIDPALANAISSITYSTSRGILMSRFQGTALENFILPVISPNDLLEMELFEK